MVLLSSAADEPIDPGLWIGLAVIFFILALIALGIFLLIWKIIKYRRYKRPQNLTRWQRRKYAKSLQSRYGVSYAIGLPYLFGLPFAYGTVCFVMITLRGFLFEYSGTTYDLPYEKICDVYIDTRKSVLRYYNQLIGPSIRVRTQYYLIITYMDNGFAQKVLSACPHPRKAEPFINAFRSQPLRASQNPQNFQL